MKEKLRRYLNRRFVAYPKTPQILDLKEELLSMMYDKYEDCISQGSDPKDAYKESVLLISDLRGAIKEVETGSSLAAFRKRLFTTVSLSIVYFLIITAVFLYLSLVTYESFSKTWLIPVGGFFVYLTFISLNLFSYSRLFNMRVCGRISLGAVFLSLIPLIFVLPSLASQVIFSVNIWHMSWLSIPAVSAIYIAADILLFAKNGHRVLFLIETALGALMLTTTIYLFVSYIYGVWSTAWILYIVCLAALALGYFISEAARSKRS